MGGATSTVGVWGSREKNGKVEEDKMIRRLVENKEWEQLTALLEKYPMGARERDVNTGQLPLHKAIVKQAPMDFIDVLLRIYPESIEEADNEGMKALHYVSLCRTQNVEQLPFLSRLLQNCGHVTREADAEGRTPFHLACSNRACPQALEMLLDAHPDGIARRTKQGKLPIHYACEYRASPAMLQVLIKAYPNGVRESNSMRSPLHYACESKAPAETIQLLLKTYFEGAAEKSIDSMLPLHLAAANKATPDVIALLLEAYPAGVQEKDRLARLAIHHALEKAAPEDTVILLLQAYPEATGLSGYFPHLPLHIAVEKNASYAVIRELLKISPSSAGERDMYRILPLRRAIKNRASSEVILEILSAYMEGASDIDEYERLAIHYACARKMSYEVISALLAACPLGSSVPDKNGQLPLTLSVMRSADKEVIELLLHSFPEAVMMPDNYAYLPLHHAIEIDASMDIINALLSLDPRCAEMRVDGKLPLHYAIETRRAPAVIKALLEAYPQAVRDCEFERGRLPLHWALERHHPLSVLELIYNAYPEESAFVKDKEGRMPIHYAVEYNAPWEIVRTLLSINPLAATAKELPFYYFVDETQQQQQQQQSSATNIASSSRSAAPLLVPQQTPKSSIVDRRVARSRPTFRRPNKTLIHYATEDMGSSPQIVDQVLSLTMPISAVDGAINLHHGYGWTFLLSQTNDEYSESVELLLDRYKSNINWIQLLCDSPDELGRPAHTIATPLCLKVIMMRLHYFGRYQLFNGPVAHQSKNSLVRLAIDHHYVGANPTDKLNVAMKFMKNRDQFDREVTLRSSIKFSKDFVISSVCSHDGDADPPYRLETHQKGFAEYPYCLVMVAAERDLMSAIHHEHFAGKDWPQIRAVAYQVLLALSHVHSLGVLHGDVKPLNLVREHGVFKFIDLGASVRFGGAVGLNKTSTGYMPPEMVFTPSMKFEIEAASVATLAKPPPSITEFENKEHYYDTQQPHNYKLSAKTGLAIFPTTTTPSEEEEANVAAAVAVTKAVVVNKNKKAMLVEQIPASSAMDMWSFGVVFFLLCTGESLFHLDLDDNIDLHQQRRELATWTDTLKTKRLSLIAEPLARNLAFQLLSKDPRRRPSASLCMSHPFFTHPNCSSTNRQEVVGSLPPLLPFRMPGMSAAFDVCLVFRPDDEATVDHHPVEESDGSHSQDGDEKKEELGGAQQDVLEQQVEATTDAAEASSSSSSSETKSQGKGEEDPLLPLPLPPHPPSPPVGDIQYAEILKQKLESAGLSVCFCERGKGLIQSKSAILILSRAAINNADDPSKNFANLYAEAPSDAFFYELRLACEIRANGLLEGGLFTLLVGDVIEQQEAPGMVSLEEKESASQSGSASNKGLIAFAPYYGSHQGEMLGKYGGSHPLPALCGVPVQAVEALVGLFLESHYLGITPVLTDEYASVQKIMRDVTAFQSIMLQGQVDEAWQKAAEEIVANLRPPSCEEEHQQSTINKEEEEDLDDDDDEKDAKLQASFKLLSESFKRKEEAVKLLEEQVELAQKHLDTKVAELQKIKYRYSIFE